MPTSIFSNNEKKFKNENFPNFFFEKIEFWGRIQKIVKLQSNAKKLVFALEQWSSSQKTSICPKKFIGAHYMSARAVVRALRAKTATSRKSYF